MASSENEAQRDLTIRSIGADDEFAAQAAVDKLLSDFGKHKGISQVIHAVAQHYERVKGEPEKALGLHRYNVEHFSSDIYAMWSQVELVYFQIRDGNEAGADEAFGKLLTLFADQPTLPKEIYQVGDEYAKALNYNKAELLYQYVIANWPGGEYEMWARTGIVKLDICLGNDANVQPALEQLFVDFNDQPALPEAVFVIGEQYYNKAFQCKNEGWSAEARENFLKAIVIWEKIITDLPSSLYTPQAYYFSADCLRGLGEHKKAIEYYQKIIVDWPDYENAWSSQYFIGFTYEKLGKTGAISKFATKTATKEAYEKVLQNYPDCPAANAARNWLNITSSQVKEDKNE